MVRKFLESNRSLLNICLTGEISEYTVNSTSQHHYFRLKDANSSIGCVMFKFKAASLRFRPQKGMKVTVQGRVSLYEPNGTYQFICESMLPEGVGALQIAYEELVWKLRAEGLFAPEHKKPLPRYPGTIAVITSPTGQAIKDIVKVTRGRFPQTKILLLPVLVEGATAPASMVKALEYANRERVADLIIIGRGGGAVTTLEVFNNEQVARAIYASEIPVVSAVGHEGNMSITDLVADLRAATPSDAAQLVVPDRADLLVQLQTMQLRLVRSETQRLRQMRQRVDELSRKRVMTDPLAPVQDKRQTLDYKQKELCTAARALLTPPRQGLTARAAALNAAVREQLALPRQALSAKAAALDAMSPLKVLGRGFALVTSEEGKPLQRVADVSVGSRVTASLSDGRLRCRVEETITTKEKKEQ